MRRTLFIVFLLLFGKTSFSQNAVRSLELGEKYSKNLSYAAAISSYEQALKNPKSLTEEDLLKAKLGLGEAYFLVRDYPNADRVYSDALKNIPILKGNQIDAYKRYAQVLSTLGRYSDSKFFWQKYTAFSENDKRGEQFGKLHSNLSPLLRNQASYIIEYLGINSDYPDFSPTYYKDGLVFVSSNRQTKAIKHIFNWDNSSFLDLYYLEDRSLLGDNKPSTAELGVGGSNTSPISSAKGKRELGEDHYTPKTANDTKLIATKGNAVITGSTDFKTDSEIPVQLFSKKINSKYHEGSSVFFDGGKQIIFTRNAPINNTNIWSKIKKETTRKLKLYSAINTGTSWTNIKELSFNSDNYSTGHPAITEDGKLLFFVSDMPGGFGGTDIYYSVFTNGNWGKPVNVGPKINTVGDEMFPFLDAAGNLYFSTDGLPGLGSLDLFVAKIDLNSKEVISPVRNLGAPFNSQFDDFGIISDENRTFGYFSSNRKNGGTDDDIYKFTRTGTLYGCRDLIVKVKNATTKIGIENLKFSYVKEGTESQVENVTTKNNGTINLCLDADSRFVFEFNKEGYVPQKIDFSNFDASDFEAEELSVLLEAEKPEPVLVEKVDKKSRNKLVQNWSKENNTTVFKARITDAFGLPIFGAKVRFIDQCTGAIQETTSKSDGSVEFKRNLECDYILVSTKDGFTVSNDLIEKTIIKKRLFKKEVTKTVSTNLFNSKIYKVGDVIRLENIYYEIDGYKLNESAKNELSKLAEILKKNPEMAIEVISHTDTRGSSLKNQYLSDQRAMEVYKYLTRQIDKNRIKAIGKGESEPVNNCGDGVECTENEHAKNRRTEFKVLQMKKI